MAISDFIAMEATRFTVTCSQKLPDERFDGDPSQSVPEAIAIYLNKNPKTDPKTRHELMMLFDNGLHQIKDVNAKVNETGHSLIKLLINATPRFPNLEEEQSLIKRLLEINNLMKIDNELLYVTGALLERGLYAGATELINKEFPSNAQKNSESLLKGLPTNAEIALITKDKVTLLSGLVKSGDVDLRHKFRGTTLIDFCQNKKILNLYDELVYVSLQAKIAEAVENKPRLSQEEEDSIRNNMKKRAF